MLFFIRRSSYSVIVGMHDQAQTEGQPVEYKVESHKIVSSQIH